LASRRPECLAPSRSSSRWSTTASPRSCTKVSGSNGGLKNVEASVRWPGCLPHATAVLAFRATLLIRRRQRQRAHAVWVCGTTTGRWSDEEHHLFVRSFEEHGRAWKRLAEDVSFCSCCLCGTPVAGLGALSSRAKRETDCLSAHVDAGTDCPEGRCKPHLRTISYAFVPLPFFALTDHHANSAPDPYARAEVLQQVKAQLAADGRRRRSQARRRRFSAAQSWITGLLQKQQHLES
jgi:hypothetical protein